MITTQPTAPHIPRKPTWEDQSRDRGASFLDSLTAKKKQFPRSIGKRLPPYGRQLLEARKQGVVPRDGVVIVLDAWDCCEPRARVVIPYDLDPTECCFDFVAGLDVFLMWDTELTPVSRCRKLIPEVLKCNPARFVVVGMLEGTSDLLWIKTSNGIEKDFV